MEYRCLSASFLYLNLFSSRIPTQAKSRLEWGTRHPAGLNGVMENKRIAKTILISCVCLVVMFGAGYIFLRLIGIVDPNACISEDRMTVPDLSGTKVEVIYMNCDTLAKDEAISVYFSQAPINGESWFAKWHNHRELVFRYDPGFYSNSPLIQSPEKGRITISVSDISQILFQRQNWRNISIDYKIEHVINP